MTAPQYAYRLGVYETLASIGREVRLYLKSGMPVDELVEHIGQWEDAAYKNMHSRVHTGSLLEEIRQRVARGPL